MYIVVASVMRGTIRKTRMFLRTQRDIQHSYVGLCSCRKHRFVFQFNVVKLFMLVYKRLDAKHVLACLKSAVLITNPIVCSMPTSLKTVTISCCSVDKHKISFYFSHSNL